ncbi:MAG TPA: flavin reductase family protein [Geobacterales bacterium]|nr:flavin reductase family protein [Geobacterales bacterium]
MDIREELRKVMRVYPQGVTVVTTKFENSLYGLTVSAFTSISLDPPLIMISISKLSSMHKILSNCESFTINFLAEDQKIVSDIFAGRIKVKDRFEAVQYFTERTGCPIIKGVRAFIECKKTIAYDAGDHSIILGEVINARKLNDKNPLVYYNQQYTTIVSPEKLEIIEDWWF